MCRLCTQRRWLGVARHADGCQLQLGLRATGYWLVFVNYGDQCVCGEHVQLVDVDVTAPGVPRCAGVTTTLRSVTQSPANVDAPTQVSALLTLDVRDVVLR